MAIANWPEVVDDDSSGTTGTPFSAAYNEAVEAAVEAVIEGADNPGTDASEIIDEVIEARDGEASLNDRLVRDLGDFSALEAEIVEARGNMVDLDARLDPVVNADGAPVPASASVAGAVDLLGQSFTGVKTFLDHPLFEPGTSAGTTAPVSGVLFKDVVVHIGSTTVETDASVFTVPANVLDVNGKALRIKAWGKTAAGGSTRTIKLFWNGTSIMTFTTVVASGRWQFEAYIVRTGATAQTASIFIDAVALGLNTATGAALAATNATIVWDTLAATLSGTVALKTTVQDSAAGANVTQLNCTVEVVG